MKIKLIDFGAENLPKRVHYNDAGADVYSTINLGLLPGHTAKIPLGFGLQLPDGFMAVIHSRSSMASKGLVAQNAPIDSGYSGEIHAIVTNVGVNTIHISKGDRIAQMVITPIVLSDFVLDLGNERGSNGFGSTGVKG